jgi:hypothetical protein
MTECAAIEHRAMGFNRRKMEDQRRDAAEKKPRPGARPMPKCLRMSQSGTSTKHYTRP